MSAGLDVLKAAIRAFDANTPIIASFPVEVDIDGRKLAIRREFWLVVSDFVTDAMPPMERRLMRTEDGLNVREKPDVASKKIGSLPKDTEVAVTGQPVNGYLKLADIDGWVAADWLVPAIG